MARIQQLLADLWRPLESTKPEVLPLRVMELVRRRDRQSEHLLCSVQLLLAMVLGVLYALAPRPPDAGMAALATVPVALTAYVALVGMRIVLVTWHLLPRWAVALSIAADFGLLLGLIWSFHWTYGQPPAFSLKAPTFVYIFVFIAIRALRFDFQYVLIAGATAAAGWLVLTVAALWGSPSGTVTRNFSHYLLSNHILIGAEFDKIFAVLCVTCILGLATWRAERTLIEAVRVQVANREIGRFLSHGVADHIARSDTEINAGDATERDAAIMFLDIRGFTRLAMTTPPDRLVALLTSFHRHIVPIVRARNGIIDKFLGDGVMITFGALRDSAQPAADALSALEEIMEKMKLWQTELQHSGFADVKLTVNGAVASGHVVFAALGDVHRLEYTVIGDAVNLAAKLEKHNKIEGTLALTPAATFRLAQQQGFEPVLTTSLRRCSSVMGVEGTLDLVCWR